ncbi:MAG: hypothetical protein C4337_10255 [Armatimonadota bacterium]
MPCPYFSRGVVEWMEWTDRALFDEQGNIVELQSVGRDITEQKRAGEEIMILSGRGGCAHQTALC